VQYSLWYVVPNTLLVGDLVTEFLCYQITDRQHIGYNIPQAVLHSLKLLKVGKIVARNMLSSICKQKNTIMDKDHLLLCPKLDQTSKELSKL